MEGNLFYSKSADLNIKLFVTITKYLRQAINEGREFIFPHIFGGPQFKIRLAPSVWSSSEARGRQWWGVWRKDHALSQEAGSLTRTDSGLYNQPSSENYLLRACPGYLTSSH